MGRTAVLVIPFAALICTGCMTTQTQSPQVVVSPTPVVTASDFERPSAVSSAAPLPVVTQTEEGPNDVFLLPTDDDGVSDWQGWDSDAEGSAIDTSRDALVAFASAELSRDEWWSQLSPFLASEAQQQFWLIVEPSHVSCRRIVGEGAITFQAHNVVTVTWPTDNHPHAVTMRWEHDRWVVTDISPVRGDQ